MSSLPADDHLFTAETSSPDELRARPRPLSRRRVRKLVRIGQCWADREGVIWRVANIHRGDGTVELHQPSQPGLRFPTFAELGRDYRLPTPEELA